jgi:hypothetical protein
LSFFSHFKKVYTQYISYATVDVSSAFDDVIVNEVPTMRDETLRNPGVPPSDCEVKNIFDVDFIPVFATVAAPATSVTDPRLEATCVVHGVAVFPVVTKANPAANCAASIPVPPCAASSTVKVGKGEYCVIPWPLIY